MAANEGTYLYCFARSDAVGELKSPGVDGRPGRAGHLHRERRGRLQPGAAGGVSLRSRLQSGAGSAMADPAPAGTKR